MYNDSTFSGGKFVKKNRPPDLMLITENIASVRMNPQVLRKPGSKHYSTSFLNTGDF